MPKNIAQAQEELLNSGFIDLNSNKVKEFEVFKDEIGRAHV